MFGGDIADDEMDDYMARCQEMGLKPFGQDWSKEMDMHPLFMDKVPEEVLNGTLDREKWPLLAAHLDEMYDDEDDTEGNASSYKDDGNAEYKKGTKAGLRKAIISYTEGLRQHCDNKEINSQLYCNRAAAQFSLGNYRLATKDCEKAVELCPGYLKAITRAALAQQKIGNRKNVIEWCDKALAIDKQNERFIAMKVKALQKLKEDERNERKRAAAELKERKMNMALLKAIRQRDLNLYLPEEGDETAEDRDCRLVESLKCSSHGHVILNEEDQLVWPVRFLYPEYATSDVIKQFNELDTLRDHLSYMFPPEGQSPEWDLDTEYNMDSICVLYDSGDKKIEMKIDSTLLETMTDHRVLIAAGVPTFEVYVRSSETHVKAISGG